jgi:transcriptional regulator with XRE-family HTH domain
VRARRAEQGVTQEALAERAGLDRSYISGIERSRHTPSLDIIVRVAEALSTTPSRLLAAAERIAEEPSG